MIFVGSLVSLEGVNRPVKTNTQTFIKFNLRHYRSDLAALPDSDTIGLEQRHCRTCRQLRVTVQNQ